MTTDTPAPFSSSGGGASSGLPVRTATNDDGQQQQQQQQQAAGSSSSAPSPVFDIVAAYNGFLARNPDLTKPLAAIEALIELLRQQPTTTIQETVEMIKTGTETLKSSVANPIPLQAGTDLFQEYILRSIKPPETKGGGAGSRRGKLASDYVHQDFDDVRQHLLNNTSLFSARARDARVKIAEKGSRYVLDGRTVLTHGGSRTVGALLVKAAENRQTQGIMFNVIYVESALRKTEGEQFVSRLRELGVPVATIPESAVAYVLPKVDRVFVGAETVCKNGGIISRLGTFQIATLAKRFEVPVWVAAETHKMAKVYPLGQYDLKVRQEIISFKTAEDMVNDKDTGVDGVSEFDQVRMVDYTPPELIANLITEAGIKLPSAVFEYLLDIYS